MNEASKDFLLGMWVTGCLVSLYAGGMHTLAVVSAAVIIAVIVTVGVITK